MNMKICILGKHKLIYIVCPLKKRNSLLQFFIIIHAICVIRL